MEKPSNWILDHIAYSCYDFQQVSDLYCDLFGYDVLEAESLNSEGIQIRFLKSKIANSPLIELISPLDEGSVLFKSLQARGPGLHHLCFKVVDLSESIEKAKNYGLRLIEGYPRKGSRNKNIAFFHPKESGGVLTEICSEIKSS